MMTVTAEHVKLLRAMSFDWDGGIEFGCIATDTKRPFGNGGVPSDIEELLGLPCLTSLIHRRGGRN
jgi:hypothetical protein